MGQFSWMYADSCNKRALKQYGKAYVPCPNGTVIYENCYDCYGMFGGYDIYDLVAEWNKHYISSDNIEKPVREQWGDSKQDEIYYQSALKSYEFQCKRIIDFVSDKSEDYMEENYGNDWKRNIGIDIASINESNAALKFPIKICKDKPDCYEKVPASKRDQYQGR